MNGFVVGISFFCIALAVLIFFARFFDRRDKAKAAAPAESQVSLPPRRYIARRSSSEGSSFALAVEPVELVEVRRELIREAQLWLQRWEASRDGEARGRLLESLDVLALLVKGNGSS